MVGRGICLFGGSFNPPHRSHVRVARAALERLRPAALLVVPCGDHPLKDGGEFAPAADRLAMCRLAFAGIEGVRVEDLEIGRTGPSYTVDTVRALRARIGLDEPVFVLIGSDNLATLDQWHEHEALCELATLVTYPRLGHPIDEAALRGVGIRFLHKRRILDHALADLPADDLNSTALRRRLRAGEPVPELAEPVLGYIRKHGLYGTGRPGS
jgi:nicotinate-nucleotide adenylyltransferase